LCARLSIMPVPSRDVFNRAVLTAISRIGGVERDGDALPGSLEAFDA
jgi:hypothetical protein